MPKEWKSGVFAGIASSFLLLIPTTGLPMVGLLSFFMPLPIFLVGLSSGSSLAVIGAFTTLLISSLAADFVLGVLTLMTVGFPAIVLTSLALLNHTVQVDDDETLEWYPAGRMLAWLSVFAAIVLIMMAIGAYLGQGMGLEEQTRQLVVDAHGGHDQIAALVTKLQIPLSPDEYIILLTSVLPPLIALNLAFMAAANAGLAQLILIRAGRAIRPSPSIKDIKLPEGIAIALAGSVGLGLLPGEIGAIGGSLAIIFLVPYFLLGLIVVHAISSAWSGRLALLTLFYLLCLFFYVPAMLVILLGLAEQWLHIRQRYAAYSKKT